MSNARQVAVGVAATVLVIALSLGFISLFSFPLFTGWISYFLLCLVPIEVVASVIWAAEQPKILGALSQPARGLSFVLLCIVVGAIVAPLQFVLAGGRIALPHRC